MTNIAAPIGLARGLARATDRTEARVRTGDPTRGGRGVSRRGPTGTTGWAPSRPAPILSLGALDFLSLVTSHVHPVVLVMRRRLKTRGDVMLTTKVPTLFDIPKPPA